MTRTAATRRIATRLGGRGRRLTKQRLIVAESLARQGQAVSALELYEKLRPKHPRLGLATVYRSLEAQVQDGMASRFERPGHISAYIACQPEHHHHLVCTSCQRVEEIAEDVVQPVLRFMRYRHDFQVDHATLDLYGLCGACRRRGGSVPAG